MRVTPIDPLDVDFLMDPYPTYHHRRGEARVGWVSDEAVRLTGYEEVSAVLRDPTMSARRPYNEPDAEVTEPARKLFDHFDLWMLTRDPPDHTRLRKLISKAFTPRVVEQLRARVEALVDELLAPAREERDFDVMAGLANPLPTRVIAELLGLPPEDHALFKRWSTDIGFVLGGAPWGDVFVQGAESLDAVTAYLTELIGERRRALRDDLLSRLIEVEEDGEQLSTAELVATVVMLLFAGHETTTNLIGNGTLALLRHPDELQTLRDNGSLLPHALEEFLRYDSPVQATQRYVTRELTLGGVAVPAGTWLFIWIGAANRDPTTFPEPDRLDVGRRGAKHLSFGGGPHYCVGAGLARLEGAIGFARLLDLPPFELAEEPTRRPNPLLRGLDDLTVAFA